MENTFLWVFSIVALLNINKKHLNEFRLIIDAYKDITPIPKTNEWKSYSNNQLWLRHIGQVMVAGGSRSKALFDRRIDLQQNVAFSRLYAMQGANRIATIHEVLIECGVRFVGKHMEKSHKTLALDHNFNYIVSFNGNFVGLIRDLYSMSGDNAELDRVYFLMDNLKFMKNKSARDFLMGIGMNQNTLAIDVRLRNIFNRIGIDFPVVDKLSPRKAYRSIEEELISVVCARSEISPLALDRILYSNYRKIMEMEYKQPRLSF